MAKMICTIYGLMSFRTLQEIVVELRKYYSLTDVFDILIVRDIH